LQSRLDEPLSRWLWLVKWLLLIPHYIVLFFLGIGFFVVTVIAFFVVLFTGRYPRSLFDYNVGVMRWWWRVSYYGYNALGTDRYPPFTLAEVPDYPATLEVDYPERLSRGLVLVKWWLLAIPHYLITAIFVGGGAWLATRSDDWEWSWGSGGLVGLLVLVAAIVLAFTGRYPRALLDFILGMDRWVLRVAAYAGLMTDQYPPFRLDMGESEPGQPAVAVGPSPTPPTEPHAAPSAAAPTGSVTGGSTAAQLPAGPKPAQTRWTAGRIASLVIGCVLALSSVGLLLAGAALLVADRTARVDGYVTSDTERLASNGYALVSDPIRLDVGGGPDWPVLRSILGDVRVRATSERQGASVFLGIAPTHQVDLYLQGVAHSTVSDLSGTGSASEHTGGAPPAPPSDQDIWVAQASGAGQQSLTWSPTEGRWGLVAMNADGSRPVAVQADAGATVPALTEVAVALLVAGALLLALGAFLIAIPVRRASRDKA
jgi:hypothetical protein